MIKVEREFNPVVITITTNEELGTLIDMVDCYHKHIGGISNEQLNTFKLQRDLEALYQSPHYRGISKRKSK